MKTHSTDAGYQYRLGCTCFRAPRIHGELLKLGIDVSQVTVSKYLQRSNKPSSQTWLTFLNNHTNGLASIDFFTVPTAHFRVLYVFVVLSHHRREIVHFNVTEHPTAEWTAQQLVEVFPFDSAPRYLLRDRDAICGEKVQRRIKSLGIKEVVTAPRSPWQNPARVPQLLSYLQNTFIAEQRSTRLATC